MACSYQPVLLTIEFIRIVGGGSTKERRWEEREREDPKNRTSTKRGKHVGHCRQWMWLEFFNTGCWCLFVLILRCKSTCKWKCTQSFVLWIYMNSHFCLHIWWVAVTIAFIAGHRWLETVWRLLTCMSTTVVRIWCFGPLFFPWHLESS